MQNTDLQTLWVYLSTSPLTGLTITLVAYLIAYTLHQKAGTHPLTNTVLISVILLIITLELTNTDYSTYFEGAQFIHFLLGPVTVALAIPLFKQFDRVKQLFIPIVVSMVAGIAAGSISVMFIADFLGADLATQISLSARSVTAPVAMGIAEQIGGIPSLTAVLAVLTGIIGAVMGTQYLNLLNIKDNAIKGVAIGNTSHGIGTARAFTLNQEMGAFAGMSMALAALINALLLPWLVKLFLMINGG